MADEQNWQDNPFYQIHSYLEWVKKEGVPIIGAPFVLPAGSGA